MTMDTTDRPEPAVPLNTEAPYRSAADDMLRDYHDARRREDQWRIPQVLLALATPVVTIISVLFALGGQNEYATIAGAVAIISGLGAALLAVEVWRWHRTAVGIGNSFRTQFPQDGALFLKDPL